MIPCLQSLTPDQCFVVTSFLRADSTTWLRAASRGCASTFVRNVQQTTPRSVYFEAAGVAEGAAEEVPRRNALSPLRCWRVEPRDLRRANGTLAASLFRDAAFVTSVVAKDGLFLKFADAALRRDRGVVAAAVRHNGLALFWAADALRAAPAIVLVAVAQEGDALGCADATLRNDKATVLTAVAQNGKSLRFADPRLQGDRDVVRRAARRDAGALRFANLDLRREFGYSPPPSTPLAADYDIDDLFDFTCDLNRPERY
mmetsp:Transcript_11756/g.38679  ORF Transcript_11756/g.38679 Transcript_11756/m.38679 type:complete len:258 (+) Transcript_11756:84-857(+)